MFMTHNQVVAGSSRAEWEDNVKNGSFNSTKMYVSDLFDYWD